MDDAIYEERTVNKRGNEDSEQFIVIALTGTCTGCSIIEKGNLYLDIYSEVYGPASYDACEGWVKSYCSEQ